MDIYESLYRCYVQGGRSNTDKAKSFRSICEDFVRSQGGRVDQFNHLSRALKTLFARKGASASLQEQYRARQLLDELNTVIHKDVGVSDQDLLRLYRDLVSVIEYLTDVLADARTKAVLAPSELLHLRGLNREQAAAVSDSASVIVVNAGPGTGKTHLLVHKMLEYLHADPKRHVVSLSFTNAAADHLRERFLALKQQAKQETGADFPNVRTATIHSYCFLLLNEFCKETGEPFDYEILDDSDLPVIAEEIAAQGGCPDLAHAIFSVLRGEEGDPEVRSLVAAYKKQHRFLSVDEILDLFLEHSRNPDFRAWMGRRLDCLLVDESQDLSGKVYEVIRFLLAANQKLKLFFVGDPRQNIFAFNGGAYANLLKFMKSVRSFSEHNLTVTYRCPKAVIDPVNALVFSDCPNVSLVLASRNAGIQGNRSLEECQTTEEEADRIAGLVQGYGDYEETAVLCSALKYLEETARALNRRGIPFEVRGGQRVLNRAVKFVNNCLKYAAKPQEALLKRALRLAPEEERKAVKEILEDFAAQHKIKLGRDVPVSEWIKRLVPFCGKEKELVLKYSEMALKYSEVSAFLFASITRKNDEFAPFYEKDFDVESKAQGKGVILSTIHSAKGLEWNNVIVAGMSKGILPSFRSFLGDNLTQAQLERNLNDEKKKFYVAATRSKKNLHLTYAVSHISQRGKPYSCELSPFVNRRMFVGETIPF